MIVEKRSVPGETVVQTVVVGKEVAVEREVIKVVEKEVPKEVQVVVTATTRTGDDGTPFRPSKAT